MSTCGVFLKVIFSIILLIITVSTISYATATQVILHQGYWVWRNDNGTDSSATSIAPDTTGFTLSDSTNIRLRLELYNTNSIATTDTLVGIYYGISPDATLGTWTQITTNSSNAFVLSRSNYFYDGNHASADIINPSDQPSTPQTSGLMIDSSSSFYPGLLNIHSAQFEFCMRATSYASLNTKYYFSIRIASNGTAISSYYTSLPNLITAGALPVELTTFTAASSSSAIGSPIVELKWNTATEVNNYGFDVERSAVSFQQSANAAADSRKLNAEGWEKIGFVKGSGNSNSPKNYSFIDDNPPSGTVEYRLKQIDNNGNFKYSQIVTVNSLPTKFELWQNYPNPFNPTTAISYQLSVFSHVTLKVYDVLGRVVATLVNKEQQAGKYSVNFNGSNLASGIYYYRISAGDFSEVKKLMLLK